MLARSSHLCGKKLCLFRLCLVECLVRSQQMNVRMSIKLLLARGGCGLGVTNLSAAEPALSGSIIEGESDLRFGSLIVWRELPGWPTCSTRKCPLDDPARPSQDLHATAMTRTIVVGDGTNKMMAMTDESRDAHERSQI